MFLISVLFWLLTLLCSYNCQLDLTRACSLQVIVDKFLWDQALRETKAVSSGQQTEQFGTEKDNPDELRRVARYTLTSLANRLVGRANQVLDRQYFGGRKFKLVLQDVQIVDSLEECGDVCREDADLESLLNTFSYTPRDDYCLSYLLTYRSFTNGKLGLAFTASPYHGGVCDVFRRQKEELHGYEREVEKSLNTGVITLERNGRRVSDRVVDFTFAHEIGHSFGSPHDPQQPDGADECWGSVKHGQYIMHPSGSLASKRNNMVFSECSIKSIAEVLSSNTNTRNKTCWRIDTGHGTCGNSVVEEWEECDCGRDAAECARQCCVPPHGSGDVPGQRPCRLSRQAQCSPSEGLCCNSRCEYSDRDQLCAQATECTAAVHCTGKASYCPVPPSRSDGMKCAAGSKLCSNGQCAGSVCPSLGMLPCVPAVANAQTDCAPHCYTPTIPCNPVNYSYPDGTECRLGDLYGYCMGGACKLSHPKPHQSWIVGVATFIVFYFIFMVISIWIYCRYCRSSFSTLHSVKQSSDYS